MSNVRYSILQALPEHIAPIAENMREADRREVWASNRKTPLEALAFSFALSSSAWVCLVAGVPAFMWGVCSEDYPLTGCPWLLATPRMHLVERAFIRQGRAYVEAMQSRYLRLENMVHAENYASIRWLSWLGFTIETEKPLTVNGEDFYLFWKEASHA